MPYTNAQSVLPPDLLEKVQSYVQGAQLYIPRAREERLGWGMKNGTRKMLDRRNARIRSEKALGRTIDELAESYNLSSDTIRKILYSKTGRE